MLYSIVAHLTASTVRGIDLSTLFHYVLGILAPDFSGVDHAATTRSIAANRASDIKLGLWRQYLRDGRLDYLSSFEFAVLLSLYQHTGVQTAQLPWSIHYEVYLKAD